MTHQQMQKKAAEKAELACQKLFRFGIPPKEHIIKCLELLYRQGFLDGKKSVNEATKYKGTLEGTK